MSDRYRFLERQLDRDDLTDEEFDLYNKELNQLQTVKNLSEDRQKQQILDKINRIKTLFEEGKVNELVQEYGHQFKDDYEITHDFMVKSHCRNERNPNLNNFWACGSIEEANKKLNQLIYHRVYDHYVRNNTP